MRIRGYNMVVNVLGTEYNVIFDTLAENNMYKQCDGYCDFYDKRNTRQKAH